VNSVVADINRDLARWGIDTHTALDVLGMVPVVGELADVANGVIYLAEGSTRDALLAFAGVLIPGSIGAFRRLGSHLDEAVAAERLVTRYGGEGLDAVAAVTRRSDDIAEYGRTTNLVEAGGDVRHADEAGAVASTSQVDAPSCPLANSFTGDTDVVMGDGTHVDIQDIQVGDVVLALDPETGERGNRVVTATIAGEGVKDLVDVTIGDQTGVDTFTATTGHPIWVVNAHAWVDAGDLRPGDLLLSVDGRTVEVLGTRSFTQTVRVHNLTVNDLHTFHIASGHHTPLTHNCGSRATNTARPNIVETETIASRPLKPTEATQRWAEFLGEGPHTNIHPRTGQVDPNRIVSADGTRSIRMGPHEMGSKPTKFHFHEETWGFDATSNTWTVDNVVRRVPLQ
jgi:hypothetical protein